MLPTNCQSGLLRRASTKWSGKVQLSTGDQLGPVQPRNLVPSLRAFVAMIVSLHRAVSELWTPRHLGHVYRVFDGFGLVSVLGAYDRARLMQ